MSSDRRPPNMPQHKHVNLRPLRIHARRRWREAPTHSAAARERGYAAVIAERKDQP